ncbi:ABC transporter substrate-binding protein [Desulfosporosinus shakirovi]|uniref:ABC transporter substrate-binding protein n=1 Tax=Desulfosporosinus shakirovi TaxID=2885154 RepID=UPI001E473198|nr:ABC transporter substrate-binding protein [Desulfosporosinus sp. SRJS8]MCB8818225.1 ABC transporter substrate-binding protein [Desulfosporosinus sp. SRJS8]
MGILTGCGSSKTATKGLVELTIASSNNAHGVSLDPRIDYTAGVPVSMGVCETLFKLNNETLKVEPHLADTYTHPDEYTWEITLRDGISFTSGEPLTAEAAKAALEYSLAGIERLDKILDLKSLEAEGQVLTIKTNSPAATLPSLLTDASTIIYDTKAGSDYARQIVGTGPYILESMDDEGNCELVKNKAYWQGEPAADLVHTKWITNGNALALALQSGELDYAEIAPADMPLFENKADYQVTGYDSHRTYFLFLNPENTFTTDPALRKALCYSIDRDSYIASIFNGNGTKTTACFPAWSGFSADISAEDYDLEKAKQILSVAGYQDSNGDGNLEKDGKEVSLSLMTYAGNPEFPVLCEVIQDQLATLGIHSEIVVSDGIVNDLKKGNWNIATYGYNTLSLGDSYNFLQPVFYTDAFSNFTHFSNPQVDALLDEMKETADMEKRKELSIEV